MNNSARFGPAITRGFFLAGAVNVFGMLAVSKFFSNSLLSALEPAIFSWLGQLAIVLWGLAYWAVARCYRTVWALVLVFCVEKMVYAAAWLLWLLQHGESLAAVASQSLMTAVFFGVYGAGDFAFGLFFGWVALTSFKSSRSCRV